MNKKTALVTANAFWKGYRKYKKEHSAREIKFVVLAILRRDDKILERYNNHSLHGKYSGQKSVHLDSKKQWVLRYEIRNSEIDRELVILSLEALGSHDEVYASLLYPDLSEGEIKGIKESENYKTLTIDLIDIDSSLLIGEQWKWDAFDGWATIVSGKFDHKYLIENERVYINGQLRTTPRDLPRIKHYTLDEMEVIVQKIADRLTGYEISVNKYWNNRFEIDFGDGEYLKILFEII